MNMRLTFKEKKKKENALEELKIKRKKNYATSFDL